MPVVALVAAAVALRRLIPLPTSRRANFYRAFSRRCEIVFFLQIRGFMFPGWGKKDRFFLQLRLDCLFAKFVYNFLAGGKIGKCLCLGGRILNWKAGVPTTRLRLGADLHGAAVERIRVAGLSVA